MVFGVKGPKAILSSAIATALAEYFVVDASLIEAKLLHDNTQIVLRKVLLREQHSPHFLTENSAGKPTSLTVTGSVDEIVFSWVWAVGSHKDERNLDAWVKDSKLTIRGLKVQAELAHGSPAEEEEQDITQAPLSSNIDSDVADAIQKEGGLKAFIKKQVEMIIDSLTLRILDFEFRVEMPAPHLSPALSSDGLRCLAIEVGGEMMELLSLGRPGSEMDSPDGITIKQRLTIGSIFARVKDMMIANDNEGDSTEKAQNEVTTYPILEPFSYSAEVIRSSGKRFSGIQTGLEVVGQPVEATETGSSDGGGLVLHAGTEQMEALTQLGVMLLVPQKDEEEPLDDNAESSDGQSTDAVVKPEEEASSGDSDGVSIEDRVSKFVFQLSSVSLFLDKNTKMTVPVLLMTYRADGSVMNAVAEGFTLESSCPEDHPEERNTLVSVLGIKASLRPNIVLEMSVVEQVYLKDVFQLTTPISNPRITYEGKTLSVNVSSVEGTMLSKQVKKQTKASNSSVETTKSVQAPGKQANKQTKASNANVETTKSVQASGTMFGKGSGAKSTQEIGPPSSHEDDADRLNKASQEMVNASTNTTTSAVQASVTNQDSNDGHDQESPSSSVMVPCPVNISVNHIQLKKATGGGLQELHDFDLYLNPEMDTNSTHVALRLGEFKNHLLHLEKANLFAVLPLDKPDEIQAFNFATESGSVTAGHSTDEWSREFEKPRRRTTKSKVLKFPFATISPLRLKIAWKSTGVAVKDTSVSILAFEGKADTTSRDLINYYAGACISRAPGFVSNAEVLGVNVVDSTATTYGAWWGFMTPLGGAGGVAAIAAVDGVKGAVDAGKRARNVDDGHGWQPGDIVRGIIYATGEATREGAVKRGKQDGKGNAADFAVGMTSATGQYVGQNKARLGGAGGAGLGMFYGTILGGPVGGIVGAVVAGAVTSKAIENVEKHTKKKTPVHQIEQAGDIPHKEEPAAVVSSTEEEEPSEEEVHRTELSWPSAHLPSISEASNEDKQSKPRI